MANVQSVTQCMIVFADGLVKPYVSYNQSYSKVI